MTACVRTRADFDNAFKLDAAQKSSIGELWLDRFEASTLFTNQGPGALVITVFDVIARKTSSTLPRTDWDQGINMEEGMDSSDPITLGAKPTDSKYFNSNWKITKTTKIELPTGRSHEHKYKFDYKGKLPISDTWNSASTFANLPGITHNQMIVMHGMPTDNTNSYTQIAGSEVSVDQTKVVGICTYSFYTRFRTRKTPKITGNTTLPLTATMGAAYIQSENDQSVVNSFTATNFA